jgi:hypothetical protein
MHRTLRISVLLLICATLGTLVCIEGGCQSRRGASRQTRDGEARAALLGLEELQTALDGPEMREIVGRAAQDRYIHHTLADGTSMLITKDQGHLLFILDDDGDMTADATGPDGDSDCLALDMDADGSLDRTFDYDDLNHDGVADQMVQTYTVHSTWGERPFLVIARDFDRGPQRLWSLDDYGYVQRACEWDCDFGGAAWFAMFRRSGQRWIATLEAPFCFYDPDGDALPEEALRLIAEGTRLESARYSINADNDRTLDQPYDYDVSVTCLGSAEVPAASQEIFTHRSGDSAGPILRWEDAREVVRDTAWERCLLIWDENDHNIAERSPDRERWEGILNAEWRGFPQEGGPPSLAINKRFELDGDYSGRMRVYWSPADARLHLHGAEQGAIEVDYDYDGKLDLQVEYADTDRDGFFDSRTISYPQTKLPSRTVDAPLAGAVRGSRDGQTLPLDYAAIAPFWRREMLARSDAAAQVLDAMRAAADSLGLTLHRDVLDFYETATVEEFAWIERLRESDEARRYYREVAVELAFAHLLADAEAGDQPPEEISRLLSARRLYDAGEIEAANERLLAPAGR